MARSVAAPKITGGGGFVFENCVCAWFLACMLVEEPPFEPELGVPVRVDFQTRPDGWLLDDILVTTVAGSRRHRIALSIKSNAQFTATSAPSDFVTDVWEQWLHIGSSVFHRTKDFLGLVTGPLSTAAAAAVSGLISKARVADPALLSDRLLRSGWTNEEERQLSASFECPSTLAHQSDVDTVRLLRRLRFLQHDFDEAISESGKRSLALCKLAVRSHSEHDRDRLWDRLRSIADELRPKAGSLTRKQLIERLRDSIALADFPSYTADWVALDSRSRRDADLIPDAIAGQVRLARARDIGALDDAIDGHDLIGLIGSSGTGKSALGKALFDLRTRHDRRTLWIDARSLDCADIGNFESSLRIQHPLDELLASCVFAKPVLVLDGLDRMYSDSAFRNAVALLRMARQHSPATQWRIVLLCQSQEWPRVLESLQRSGNLDAAWMELPLAPLAVEQLAPVGTAFPALKRLLLDPKVGKLLTNLKLLDLVARHIQRGTSIDAASWVGESSVAEWFWGAEIDRGIDRVSRGRFARELAQRQADELHASIPVDAFGDSGVAPVASLRADQLCILVPGDRVAFAHDLYGDWARLRILINHRQDLSGFFKQRQDSPLWHRALRLFGIYLLEHAGEIDEWRTALTSFRHGEALLLQDVLLEAPVFAMNSRRLLDAVLPELLSDKGRLLRRLLVRFMSFATVPNDRMVAAAISFAVDPSTARATYRIPHWPLWLDVLAFLHEHRTDVLSIAASEIARIVEMWLSFAPKGRIGRNEVAELAILLGRYALETRGTYAGSNWRSDRERFYTCVLAAAHERPDDVVEIALMASARREALPDKRDVAPAHHRRYSVFGGTGVMRGPWPDGPKARVDEALQHVVLDSVAILELFRIRPAAAREIVLANLIPEPVEERWTAPRSERGALSVDRFKWSPSLYSHGPFLAFLRANFTEGLELVARFVEFAAARECDELRREANEWRKGAIAAGQPEDAVDQRLAEVTPGLVILLGDDGVRTLVGDSRLYHWSAGLGAAPYAVTSALMALEQYFYQRLDEGSDITSEVQDVLARCESVALLGVLCDVGKRQISLFEGPLRSLLSAPEIYAWEIEKLRQGRSHQLLVAHDQGERIFKQAQDFHCLSHRNMDLRYIARALFFRPSMREYFDRVRDAWSAVPKATDRFGQMREQLAVALDIRNYESREDADQGTVLVNVEQVRRQQARADEKAAYDDLFLVTGFPSHCRTLLDERKQLDAGLLANLWAQWGRIRELSRGGPALPTGEVRFGDEYKTAIMAGSAVFLWHTEWCAQDDSRNQTVVEAVRDLLAAPSECTVGYDSRDFAWTFDSFAAEAVAMLWTREPSDTEWRTRVAEQVFSSTHTPIRLLFSRCSEARTELGEDFGRLRRLAVEWAYVKVYLDLLLQMPHEAIQLNDDALERVKKTLVDWAKERVESFASASLSGLPNDWSECDVRHRFVELEPMRRQWADHPDLDFRVIRHAHEWLPLPDNCRDEQDRHSVLQFWRTAVAFVVARHASRDQQDAHSPPEDERWVLKRVAVVLLQLRKTEQPELLWQPVLELPNEMIHWSEVFVRALHQHALASPKTPDGYVELVRSMLHYSLSDVDGTRCGSSSFSSCIMGIDGSVLDRWQPRHEAVVRELRSSFLQWMGRVSLDGRRLRRFASWLARPCSSSLRLTALQWLADRVLTDANRDFQHADDETEVEVSIAALLNVVWSEQQQVLRVDSSAFRSFRRLLQWLGERQNPLGLELLGRIGNLT